MQVKRLLVATDLSERSDRAFDRAIRMARKFQAKLTVLHVVEGDLPPLIAEAQAEASLRNLEEQLASISDAADLEVDLSVVFGKDWSEILKQAEAARSDLIILGLHREVGLDGLFRGTTVERVIRKGDRPVLVVKDRAVRDYRNVVVGMDFSLNSRRAI
ncbi:MAG: universal stress protein, partial [Rhodospirillaceae bacterium]